MELKDFYLFTCTEQIHLKHFWHMSDCERDPGGAGEGVADAVTLRIEVEHTVVDGVCNALVDAVQVAGVHGVQHEQQTASLQQQRALVPRCQRRRQLLGNGNIVAVERVTASHSLYTYVFTLMDSTQGTKQLFHFWWQFQESGGKFGEIGLTSNRLHIYTYTSTPCMLTFLQLTGKML
jgi:hypothetical protein